MTNITNEKTSLSLETLFASERVTFREGMNNASEFHSFRQLPDSLLTLIYCEKMRLAQYPATRLILKGDIKSGIIKNWDGELDAYHPKVLTPFELKGYWIPESEGQVFSEESETFASPLIRTGKIGREILFLVHPKSETLFSPLIQKYGSTEEKVSALSLSSFRTLLIALDKKDGSSEFAMVKVSLNSIVGAILRTLSLKESAGSIANSMILANKVSNIEFLRETFSFVPFDPRAGMIIRAIPDYLMNPQSKEYIIPLFSLIGAKNADFLATVIQNSHETPTNFFITNILLPLAMGQVQLLFKDHTSIEAHGQNLMLKINTSDPDNVQFGLVYRDMGGVNSMFSRKEWHDLPANLRNKEYYYHSTHAQDAADALEKLVGSLIYNFTKSAYKSKFCNDNDPDFKSWKDKIIELGFEANWHIEDSDPDAHAQTLPEDKFYRYGYFEKLYGVLLLGTMVQQGIFEELEKTYPNLQQGLQDLLIEPNNPFNQNVDLMWFATLIKSTYKDIPEIEESI